MIGQHTACCLVSPCLTHLVSDLQRNWVKGTTTQIERLRRVVRSDTYRNLFVAVVSMRLPAFR